MICLTLIPSVGIPGAVWRAGFVAAVALIAFLLVRHWKSLAAQTNRTRILLVGLRGSALFLVACAAVGMQIGYESESPRQVLVHLASQSNASSSTVQHESDSLKRITTSLKDGSIEFVEPSSVVSEDGAYPVASLFVTDAGMESGVAASEVERAQSEAGGGPVFVVSLLGPNDLPRASIESISILNRPMLGVPLTVQCNVHASGMNGRSSLVTVADDANVRASAEARWSGDDDRQMLSLEVVPKSAGWVNYSVKIEGDKSSESAVLSRPFTIFVEERRQSVLFMEGEPTWESKFIRRALESSELFDVDYFAQVSRTAFAGANVSKEGTEPGSTGKNDRSSTESNLRTALSSSAKLNSYDCIVIGATPDTLLSKPEATRLIDWVERRGGGLIILGENNFSGSIVASKSKLGLLMPAEPDSSSFRSATPVISRSTPVEAGKSTSGIPLNATEAGRSGPLRGYSNAMEGNAVANALSGEGFRLGRLRPGATVLAVNGQKGPGSATGEGEPLVVAMRFGVGRSIVFAPADSWRLRTSESSDEVADDSPFAALWQGLTLWAASTARPPVEIELSDESPQASREATAEIRVLDEAYIPSRIEKLSARLLQLTEVAGEVSSATLRPRDIHFYPDTNDSSIWRAQFSAPQPGRFSLQVEYTANGKTATVEKKFATVVASAVEPGASNDTLRRVSRVTGGDLFSASELNALRDRIASLPHPNRRVRRKIELQSWWPLAFLIPILLSTAWLIERIKSKTNEYSR